MKRMTLLLVCIVFGLSACSSKQNDQARNNQNESEAAVITGAVDWTETADDKTETRPSLDLIRGQAAKPDVEVNTNEVGQIIEGFGGAFNEAGWDALSVLSEEDRNSVMETLFDPQGQGTRFNLGRVPIGSSDYALVRYSHNETPGDFGMENFSIQRDYEYLIPYIKAAMEYNPDLAVWGSAWSPPTWMKTNKAFNSGHMLDDPQIYDAYALYLVKFIQAYQAEGINMMEVAVQNEPKILNPYPTCEWEPAQFYTFVKDHLGPLMAEEQVEAGIMLGTFNFGDEYNSFIKPILSDEIAGAYVTSVGFQWGGDRAVGQTRFDYPYIRIVQTETDCGNWHWQDNWERKIPGFRFNSQRPQNDYGYAAYTWTRIRDYFREGVNSYYLWNIILDEKGWNNDAIRPWPQNSAIVIDRNSKTVIYTPMYKVFWHFSHFIEAGARYIPSKSRSNNASVFRNPDGTYVIEIQNNNPNTKEVVVQLENYYFTAEMAPNSFQTFLVNPENND